MATGTIVFHNNTWLNINEHEQCSAKLVLDVSSAKCMLATCNLALRFYAALVNVPFVSDTKGALIPFASTLLGSVEYGHRTVL